MHVIETKKNNDTTSWHNSETSVPLSVKLLNNDSHLCTEVKFY